MKYTPIENINFNKIMKINNIKNNNKTIKIKIIIKTKKENIIINNTV